LVGSPWAAAFFAWNALSLPSTVKYPYLSWERLEGEGKTKGKVEVKARLKHFQGAVPEAAQL
jgi:hypothetical protein